MRVLDFNAFPPPAPPGLTSRYAGELWFDANPLELLRRQACAELTKDPRHARAASVSLEGPRSNYVNFNHAPNLPLTHRIAGPVHF